MSLNESTVQDAALGWFGDPGYAIGYGPLVSLDFDKVVMEFKINRHK